MLRVEIVGPPTGGHGPASLTANFCCGTVDRMTEPLYEDSSLRLDEDGITIRRYWFPLDIHRPRKKKLLILDIGARVHPCITPDDPDRAVELLRDRVPTT
jgi:hypothetical protein